MSTHPIKTISIYAIYIPESRHLPLRPDVVEKLAESISSVGLLQPIVVEPDEHHDTFRLLAGRHRLEALKRLGIENLPATVVEGLDALDAEAAELSENLIRQELSAVQKSLHFSRLMEIAEMKHRMRRENPDYENDLPDELPQNEGVPVSGNKSKSAIEVAKQTNRSPSAVERDMHRVRHIPGIGNVVGTSLDAGVELDALAALPEAIQQELIKRAMAGERVSARTELKKAERAEKERTLGEKQKALPTGKYSIVYADVPWAFKTHSDAGKDRSPEMHYPTMALESVMDLPIGDIAESNSVLFMWATAPMLPEAIEVMKVWGFSYKSHFCWVKNKMGLGYWARNQHELLLIGTRGQVIAPAPGSQFPSVISEPVGNHSEKPEAFYRIIESYFPSVSKIELFARNARPNWSSWGNQAPEAPAEAEDHDSWDAPDADEIERQGDSEFDEVLKDVFGID
jgi:N6-adenosine-specific RNA methylase IME4/ParB-like chromosome segregation protein Spo0J